MFAPRWAAGRVDPVPICDLARLPLGRRQLGRSRFPWGSLLCLGLESDSGIQRSSYTFRFSWKNRTKCRIFSGKSRLITGIYHYSPLITTVNMMIEHQQSTNVTTWAHGKPSDIKDHQSVAGESQYTILGERTLTTSQWIPRLTP